MSTLTPSILSEIVAHAIKNVKESEVFAASLKTELSEYEYMYEQLNEETHEFSVMQTLFDGYLKNGNAEKFYGKFYAQVPLNAANFFQGLSRNSATLLASKVANSMLTYCKNMMSPTDDSPASHTTLSDKEKAGLQYIGVYVLHKLHKKYARNETPKSQHAMALLKAGKLEHGCESHKLVSTVSRGGLWCITESAQNIFSHTEHYFRHLTCLSTLRRIDIAKITLKSVTDNEVLSNYQSLISDAELIPDSHVCRDVLHAIVTQYVRVRSFSFAKDKIQHYKMKQKQTKGKALRKELLRSCAEHEQDRYD